MKKYAPVLDLLFVLLFVTIGLSAHQHGITAGGLASVTWPFAVGLGVGWLVTRRRHRSGDAPLDGFVIVAITVALGMILRVVSSQGTAFAFIIVALAFLSLFLVGWRLVARGLAHRR
jgi:hypothetical protein